MSVRFCVGSDKKGRLVNDGLLDIKVDESL